MSVKEAPLIRPTGLFRIDLADVLAGRVAFAHAVEGALGQVALCRRVDVVMPDGTIMHVGRAHGSGLKLTFERGAVAQEQKPPAVHPWPFEVVEVGAGNGRETRLVMRRRWNDHGDQAELLLGGTEFAKAVHVGDEFRLALTPEPRIEGRGVFRPMQQQRGEREQPAPGDSDCNAGALGTCDPDSCDRKYLTTCPVFRARTST